jgi:hypothetical protein
MKSVLGRPLWAPATRAGGSGGHQGRPYGRLLAPAFSVPTRRSMKVCAAPW